MKIKDKTCIVFDIEVLKNVFTCTCKNTETKEIKTFEISSRKVEIDELIMYFAQDCYFVGYNNIHYDNPVLNYIFSLRTKGYFDRFSTRQITESIFRMSQIVINKDSNFELWKEYKYARTFLSIDLLTMLYSKALRVSLKSMQVTMEYKNVEEFVVDWHQDLPEENIDKLISYNINDVESTEELLNRCKKDLDLRLSIEQEYNMPCLSLDGVNIGMKILQKEYIKYTGIDKKVLEAMRSPCDIIDLNKVIFPWIKFKDPLLKQILEEMKSQHNVSPGRKGYERSFQYGGMNITIGVGGIHGDCGVCSIIPKSDELLLDSDVNSLYPSMIIEHNLYPPHLGVEFKEVYSNIRTERLIAKRNKIKTKDKTYKLALNGLSGNLQNENSWCYSPFTVMQIRINGQLLLLMLAERLFEAGCKLHQINTDGILYRCKKAKYDNIQAIMHDWEKETSLTLATERFTSFYQLAINDYFGVTPEYENTKDFDEDIKKKGAFLTNIVLGKGLTPKIIPEAIIHYFVNGTKVEDYIKNCKNIKKFLQSEKTGKQWTVEYNDKIQQRTNRFYVSTNGYYLWKWKDDTGKKQYQNMLKGHGVTLHNTFYSDEELQQMYSEGKSFEDIYNVDYQYYISQCIKIIEQLKPKQLNLFDFDEF